jgi:hypothetical protein
MWHSRCETGYKEDRQCLANADDVVNKKKFMPCFSTLPRFVGPVSGETHEMITYGPGTVYPVV